MSNFDRENDSDSSDSDDDTLILVSLLTLNIEARHLLRRRSGIPRRIIHRDHFARENLIQHHYFGPNPVYPPHVFRRRYEVQTFSGYVLTLALSS
jgi:hypothetical protein